MRIGFYAPCNEHNRHTGPLLGIAYIAAYLREQLGIEDVYLEVDARKAMERKPDLLAISSFSEKYNQVIKDVSWIRQERPDLPIVLGGPHISGMPQSLIRQIDIGVIGEGEKPMLGIVQALLADGRLDAERLRQVQNLVFWNEKNALERTLFEDRIKDLDALPLPRREIMKAWWPSLNQEVVFDRGIYTSRGCSFRCHFCMYSERANLIRYVSIPKVMEDIQEILRRHPDQRHIIFHDDLFVIKKSRLKELSDAIRSERLHQRVTFGCMAKTSFFDREFAQILRDMNMRMISWGFESGSDPVLHYLKDRSSSVAKHQQAVDICHRYGIYSGGYFIIGAPPETREDLAKTYWFIRHNLPRLPILGVYPIIPLPGTTLWQETEKRGLIDQNFDRWENLEFLRLEDSYLHLNEHYDRVELKQIYEDHFTRVMGWPNLIFPRIQERWQQTKPYLQQAAASLKAHLAPGSRLLELSRGERALAFELEHDYAHSECHWQDSERLAGLNFADYDAIILTHTLEKIGFDSPLWQAIRASGKPLYLIVEQVGTLATLLAVLGGRFPATVELAEMYQNQYRFTLKTLQQQLERQGLGIRQLERFSMPSAALPEELEAFLHKHLPVQDFLQEAEVFAYGLLAVPVRPLVADAGSTSGAEGTPIDPCVLASST